MGRTIVTAKDVDRQSRIAGQNVVVGGPGPTVKIETPDTYKDRLLKFIPAEVVAIYLAMLNVLKSTPPESVSVITVQWALFGIILAVSVLWQRKVMQIQKWPQVIIGTIAFVLWAISLGDPFTTSWKPWYQPVYGTMAMMLYTFLIPLFEPESA